MFITYSPLRVADDDGNPVPALWYTYEEDGTTPAMLYTSEALDTAHPWPLESDANGVFPRPYGPAGTYRFKITTVSGYDVSGDPIEGDTLFEIPDWEQPAPYSEMMAAIDNCLTDTDGVIEPRHMEKAPGGSIIGVNVDGAYTEHPRPVSGFWDKATALNVEPSARDTKYVYADYDFLKGDLFRRIVLFDTADLTLSLSKSVSDDIPVGHYIEIAWHAGVGGTKRISVDADLELNNVTGHSEVIRPLILGSSSIVRLIKTNTASWVTDEGTVTPIIPGAFWTDEDKALTFEDAGRLIYVFGSNDVDFSITDSFNSNVPITTEIRIFWQNGVGGNKTVTAEDGIELNHVVDGSVRIMGRSKHTASWVTVRKISDTGWIVRGDICEPQYHEALYLENSYTLTKDDIGKDIIIRNSNTMTITIPENVSDWYGPCVVFEIEWPTGNSGTKSLTVDSPLTLNDVTGGTVTFDSKVTGECKRARVRQYNAGRWSVAGDVSTAT